MALFPPTRSVFSRLTEGYVIVRSGGFQRARFKNIANDGSTDIIRTRAVFAIVAGRISRAINFDLIF